jgi:hypothetical protein
LKTWYENRDSDFGTCQKCRVCVLGTTYMTTNCTDNFNTQCIPCPMAVSNVTYYTANCTATTPSVPTSCRPLCETGTQFETRACTIYANRQCQSCSQACPAEMYKTAECSYSKDIECTSCRNCSAGLYVSTQCSTASNRNCTVCPPGSITSSLNTLTCSQCVAGTYAQDYASTVCLRCSAGTYMSGPGASVCLACGEGKYSIVSGVSSCTTCPVATYLSNATLGTCTECPNGTYSARDGVTACKLCDQGTFSTGNVSACTSCREGFITATTGQSACSACLPGTYNSNTSMSSCELCQAGKYANFSGASSCISCGPGNFSASPGYPECAMCPIGKRSQSTSGSTSCVDCVAGTYASSTGWSSCKTCDAQCVLGVRWTEVNCTAATNRVCSLCSKRLCSTGQTSNVTWCPPNGIFDCMPCPVYGNDYVHLVPEYSCATCPSRHCGETPGTYRSEMCPSALQGYTVNDTFSCGRCLGCNYRQYVKSWSFCNGLGGEAFDLNPEYEETCAYCETSCRPGQFITNLCTGRTTNNTETCKDCTSCALGHYHVKPLYGQVYPDYEGKKWLNGYVEMEPCDGKGILDSDGVSDCERCDSCPNGQYASDVKRCTGRGVWKDNFTCTDCIQCPSGYEHTVPCDGMSFNDSCKLCPACTPGFYMVSDWNSTSKRMQCGCRRCLDSAGDVCPRHSFRTNRTCTTGGTPYDEACEECSLCNAGEFIAGGNTAVCQGNGSSDVSAGKCRQVLCLFLNFIFSTGCTCRIWRTAWCFFLLQLRCPLHF